MEKKKLPKKIIALLCGVLLCAMGVITAFAIEEGELPVENEPAAVGTETPEPPQPETAQPGSILTDPPTTVPIVTAPPVTEPVPTEPPSTAAPTQAETTTAPEATEESTRSQGPGGYVDNPPVPTDFVPPTIPKTVSEKTYSTNYAFGIISWVCVLVGIIVILSVAASTKLSAARRRRV